VVGLEARGTIGLATIPFAGLAPGAEVVVGRTWHFVAPSDRWGGFRVKIIISSVKIII
jgi:hypothetical protein